MNICLNPQESHVVPDGSPSTIMCTEPHCGYLVNGAIVEGWRVNSLFGQGPVSDLYLASSDDSRSTSNMIVKVLKWEPIGPPTRLMASLQPILALRHPHILPIQGFGWTGNGGKLFLIMPYAELGSLMRYLQASTSIPPLAAAGLVLQMASALQHAHEQRMVHGRLTLDNCLLVSPATVQISDFYRSLLEDIRTVTSQGTAGPISVPAWEHVEPATDQYGLAGITCQMLLGQVSFQDSTQAVLAQHPEGGVGLIRSLRPDLPGQVGDILLRALHPQPQRRFTTIMEFATNLQAALEYRSPSHPSSWPSRAQETPAEAAAVRMSPSPLPQARVFPAQANAVPSAPPSGLQTACTLPGHTSPSTVLRWAPNGMFLASGNADRSVHVWRIVKRIGTPMGTLLGHTAEVLCLAWAPNSRLLASAGADATVRLWEFTGPSGDQARTEARNAWWAHEGATAAIDWAPSGTRLATGGSDRTIRLWSPDGTALSAWPAHGRSGVTALAWSPDGQLLASGGTDRVVNLWDPQTNTVVLRFESAFDEVRRIAWSPDGNLLAFCGGKKDTAVSLWHLPSRRHIATVSGHAREITGLFWGRQGNWLGTASADATLRLWRTDSGLGEPFGRSIPLPGTPLVAAASLDTGLVALGLDDMLVHVLEFTR
jgi:serine/threonine protein kinase